jgi:trehalose 6-phosphate synthase
VTDAANHVTVRVNESSYTLRRVWLTSDEERGYYQGFANEGLWPLCHLAFAAPIFRRSDWLEYQRVNERFADAVAGEVRRPRPVILVQDYHFALLPRKLRQRCPDALIVTFWHIPWPYPEPLCVCPYSSHILEGLLGSDVVGFQTSQHCHHFLDAFDQTFSAHVDREQACVVHGDRSVCVRPYPISIEWPSRWTISAPPVEECRRAVRAELGLHPEARVMLSVDRLDYTKGFEERLAAIERLLSANTSRRKLTFVQIAAPTRVSIERYRDLGARVRARIEHLNHRFGDGTFVPIRYIERFTEPGDVYRYYRAADVCYVGSLDDGMNLVAKEFVAGRDDEEGVLILSRFAGAARELADAVVVNPFDIDGVADAFTAALTMPRSEQRRRMRRMRCWVAEHDVYAWATKMLDDAATLVPCVEQTNARRYASRLAP